MSDLFGLLELPAQVPNEGEALTDPILDVLLCFMQSVLNHDLGAAWARRCPTDPLPVAYTFAHNPDLESFNANETAALYLYRAPDPGNLIRYSQDLLADQAGFHCLWVPPPATQEDRRFREAIRNGIKKSLKVAFAAGRHPAWVVPGDDYYDPETYGSVLLRHTGAAQLRLGQFRAHELVIDNEFGGVKQPFDCLFFTIEGIEFFTPDALASGEAVPLDHLEGVVHLPPRDDIEDGDRIAMVSPGEVLTYHIEMEATSLSPSAGDADGDETVTITGKQFVEEGMEVTFGGTAGTLVTYVDESTITVRTPAHAAGAVDVVVTAPSGVVKTLAAAFTYS